jgi:hypothetical protein
MTKDSCFEVPHLAESPIRITTRHVVEHQPEIKPPTLLIIKNILPPFIMENYNDDLESDSDVRLLSNED